MDLFQKIFLSVTRYNKRKTKHFYFIHVSILWRVTFRILNEIYFVIIEHQKNDDIEKYSLSI